MTSSSAKLPGAVRRAVTDLEAAYADPDVDDATFTTRVDALGRQARTLSDAQRTTLNERLAAARERAGRARFLAAVTAAARTGNRRLVRVLDTGEEVWHVQLPDGEAVLVVPTVTPDMPAELADALTRSRLATFEGRCACGGRLTEAGGTLRVAHTRRCPAHDDALAALRRTRS